MRFFAFDPKSPATKYVLRHNFETSPEATTQTVCSVIANINNDTFWNKFTGLVNRMFVEQNLIEEKEFDVEKIVFVLLDRYCDELCEILSEPITKSPSSDFHKKTLDEPLADTRLFKVFPTKFTVCYSLVFSTPFDLTIIKTPIPKDMIDIIKDDPTLQGCGNIFFDYDSAELAKNRVEKALGLK